MNSFGISWTEAFQVEKRFSVKCFQNLCLFLVKEFAEMDQFHLGVSSELHPFTPI